MVKNKFKSRRTLQLILTFLILNSTFYITQATVRYVSHTGSSTPPYTSWATAADSIQKCINICVFGDTIYVANGIYEEQVVMIPGLSLIGAGMDSCVIDTRNFSHPIGFASVKLADSTTLKNFGIIVSNANDGFAINSDTLNAKIELNRLRNGYFGISLRNSNSLVIMNVIQNFEIGILQINSEAVISNNQITNIKQRGIWIDAFNSDYYPVVEKNVINTDMFGIIVQLGNKPTIRNNIIFLNGDGATGYRGGGSDSVWVYNNLVVSENDFNFTHGLQNSIVPTIEYNNFLIGNFSSRGIYVEDFNTVKNNNVMNSPKGITRGPGNTQVIEYNNSWNNTNNYEGFIPDTTNISVDPMVVSEDSLDFHLQMFSPLVDAGDPMVLDTDSTRSDIGLYGGPYGESYTYLDLPPKPPVNLTAEVDSIIRLSWNRNEEADFNHYNLYRDTTGNFTIDTTKLVASVTDTFYQHIIPTGVESLYFKLTGVDKQGNESNPSEELVVIITSVIEFPQVVSNYQLFQNYPNPFNPSTTIGYKLKERGYVKLYVYDVKGELVSVLVNQIQEAGYYEVEFGFDTENELQRSGIGNVASGIYIYQLMVKSENDIPTFSDIKKMILLK